MAEKFEKCCKFKIELKGTKATRTVIFPVDSGGTDPSEYVAVNMSLSVKSWCDILRAE